jgi:hypothetical protein
MNRFAFAFFIASTFLIGCMTACDDPVPVQTEKTSNPHKSVDLLFIKDGCKMYRFTDLGRDHYFTTCSGSTITDQQSGKTTYSEEIPTK